MTGERCIRCQIPGQHCIQREQSIRRGEVGTCYPRPQPQMGSHALRLTRRQP